MLAVSLLAQRPQAQAALQALLGQEPQLQRPAQILNLAQQLPAKSLALQWKEPLQALPSLVQIFSCYL